jgi:hypothetical protein
MILYLLELEGALSLLIALPCLLALAVVGICVSSKGRGGLQR